VEDARHDGSIGAIYLTTRQPYAAIAHQDFSFRFTPFERGAHRNQRNMIDNLSILLSHVLLALAFWFLTLRDDLNHEDPPAPDAEPEGFGHAALNRKRPKTPGKAASDA
jgi:hypothetical protein